MFQDKTLFQEATETAVEDCPERMDAADAEAADTEAAESIRSEAGMALQAMLALEAVVALKAVVGLSLTAVDICPERMDAADAEAPGPPRIETAVEF